VKGLTGLALGFILVGTADANAASDMLQLLMEKSSTELADPNMRFLALGIALLFLGRLFFLLTHVNFNFRDPRTQ
jgi:26S proteasome regulatory subunit N1